MSDEKKGLSLPVILGIVFGAVILAAVTSFFLFNMLGGEAGSGEDMALLGKGNEDLGPTYSLGQFIVNLPFDGGYRFLKTELVVELSDKDLVGELEERNPQIRDIVIKLLRGLEKEELEDPGNEKLKERIKASINEVLHSGRIQKVFFTDFVIQ